MSSNAHSPLQSLLARKDAELEERGQLLLKSKAALEQLQRERDELREEAQQVYAYASYSGLASDLGSRPDLTLASLPEAQERC